MKFSQLIQQLGDGVTRTSLSLTQEDDPEICGVADVDEATLGTLSFIENRKFADRVKKTAASALILPPDEDLISQAVERKIAWIATAEPRLLFARTLALFYQPFQPTPEIHPQATIDRSATIGENVSIGANVVICGDVEIEDRVCIHPNVVIYPQVRIGRGTILHANCTIHERSQIGKNCVIHSGAVIGAEGFGFVPTSSGWFKMQQSGCTILEDSVEIGCNSTIDRPAVGETRIGRNTKIDNLVQIGHGCKIGSNCALAAQVGLAGRVTLGNNILLAGQVGVANQAKIGDGAIASAKTGIHQDVAPGAIVSGFPAIANKLWLKNAALYKRLPEIYQTIQKLQRRMKSQD
ncbi:UDP-3-O-(3-hydroxymyristoyl)glucosamine N-acyltransferase [Oscillatoriales cyanobacterium LEGE 11467]|uniref:UDP-3-O-acylglucosamine N-acyltransferase n=1 Tax=Zarconia navalis LEGE 11467 TaxID=1828826 RepID=A0A928VTV1_9CYAN|nr:UDP-3-O-(3-hydroxymyristoyl)glucosamine N-acyltransferase [Zarconia navalis]MBE9040249.1 UDP-3-O-(3-hydroxymyristoyl)glucosamine N-acyltransferase [Zarconia navalis LEGE 11467]